MKKTIVSVLTAVLALTLVSCGKQPPAKFTIRIPAGNTTEVIYTDEQLLPKGRKLTLSTDAEQPDLMVELKPVDAKEERAYEPIYLTPGMPVEVDVEKDTWLRLGAAAENPTDEELEVRIQVEGLAEFRIVCSAEPEPTAPEDLPPMVMVNGVLYQDTGKLSTLDGRCGTMDGEITSSVDSTQSPTENDQSNFGTGYGYQITGEDTLEILIHDQWCVFQAEKTA